MRKLLVALPLTAALALAGCSGDSTPPAQETTQETTTVSSTSAEAQEGTRSFTDSSGRTVEIPATVTRVASGGPLANIMLYAMAPDRVVGLSDKPAGSAQGIIDEEFMNLPEYGRLYNSQGDFNREALMAAEPELIVDVGMWDEEYKAQTDELQEQIGIPILIIDGHLENSAQAFREVADVMGEEARGEELAAMAEQYLALVEDKAEELPEERTTVYVAEDEDGLSTVVADTIHSEIIDAVGGEILVGKDEVEEQRGGGTVSLEQLLAWDPDVILTGRGADIDTLRADPAWQALSAVQNDRIYEVPQTPYNWIGRPPGPNRLIGIPWLGNLLYPDVYDVDVDSHVRGFFDLMYRYHLSDEELDELLANSTRASQNA